MKRHLVKTFFASFPFAFVALNAWGQQHQQVDGQTLPATLPYRIAQKHMMPSAVQVRITPRGATYFEKKMASILGNLGVSLDDGQFEATKYEAQKAINLDQLELPPQTKELVGRVRSLLTDWLIGFPIKDIRPSVEIGSSGYSAIFNRFALVPDEALLQQLGKQDGAVLAIELEIKELNTNLSRLRAFDINSPILGQVGVDGVSAKIGGGPSAVKLRLPFYVRINEKEQLEFQALEMTENFRSVNIELKYKKLVAPQIILEVNGYRMEFNQARLEKELITNMPLILEKARGFLSEFSSQRLPALLNQKAKEMTKGTMEEVNRLDPPGAEKGHVVEPFLWGLRLEKISQKNGIGIKLKAFVEDPVNPNSTPVKEMGPRGPVVMNHLDPKEYDIALSVDRALVNRILQLSFERKMFEKISVGPGILKLTATPTIDYFNTPVGEARTRSETYVKLKLKVRVPDGSVAGFNKLFLRDNFEVSFDLIAKLRKAAYNGPGSKAGVDLILSDILTDDLWINPEDIKMAGRLVPKTVLSGVASTLKAISADWKKTEVKLPGTLPLPPEILGIKTEIDYLLMDPAGHLVMYLKYSKESL